MHLHALTFQILCKIKCNIDNGNVLKQIGIQYLNLE